MGRLAKVLSKQAQPGLKAFKEGGKVMAHSDAAQDKKLIAAELKARGLRKGGKCK